MTPHTQETTMPEHHPLNRLAGGIFEAAKHEQREGELLECLFAGGSATIDPDGRLVLATADMLAQMAGEPDPPEVPTPGELLESVAQDLAELVELIDPDDDAASIAALMGVVDDMSHPQCQCLLLAAVVTIRTMRDTLRAKP